MPFTCETVNIMNILSINCGLCATGVHHFLHMPLPAKGFRHELINTYSKQYKVSGIIQNIPLFNPHFLSPDTADNSDFPFWEGQVPHMAGFIQVSYSHTIHRQLASITGNTNKVKEPVCTEEYVFYFALWMVGAMFIWIHGKAYYVQTLWDIIYVTDNIPNHFLGGHSTANTVSLMSLWLAFKLNSRVWPPACSGPVELLN